MPFKWSDIAKAVIPVVGAFVPALRPLVPAILVGISEADALAGASNDAKRQHVLTIVTVEAQAASATGKLAIDPATARNLTDDVFDAIDDVKKIAAANTNERPF
jgi:hypothetical protein